MRKYILSFVMMFGLALAGFASAYTVQQGDVLWRIAEDNNTTVQRLVDLNDIKNPNLIFIGQELNLGYDEVFGGTPTPTSSAPRKYVESPDFQLFTGAAAGDTSITLDDLEDIYGNNLTMDDIGTIGYGRINPNGTSEAISFSGLTRNSDGTVTLTGVSSTLAKYPYSNSAGLALSHSIGTIFRLTNTAAFYNDFANKENDEIIDGIWHFVQLPTSTVTPTQDQQLITKAYADSLAFAGAPDAATNTKGVMEKATGAEAAANAAIGSGDTTAPLGLTTDIASSTSLVNGVVITNGSGKIDSSFLDIDSTTTLQFTGNTLSVQATTTPTASKIPIADSNGQIDAGWINVNDSAFSVFKSSRTLYVTTTDYVETDDDGVTTTVATTTFDAGEFTTSTMIRFRLNVTDWDNATAASATNIALKIGTTVIALIGPITPDTTISNSKGEIEGLIYSGGDNAQDAFLRFSAGGDLVDFTGTAANYGVRVHTAATSAIDTSAGGTVSIDVWSSNVSGTNTFTVGNGSIELLKQE